ncbi:DUF58 domain-containing protein [Candidatus Woesearchaeota archaeon]|jgi:uncharacterized protein (DUF58 family)|nr:DUF58 domain-containing protein [Candidatus Woesearchaeota archaeon]
MIDTAFLEQLKRFSLIVRKRVTSNYKGARRSIAMGRGLQIKDYRYYVPGDDIRLLDWKVFARTNKLYTRQYEEDRTLSVHIIIDKSSSMDFGKHKTKYEYGSMIGLGFAYMALKENDKFEFSTFANELDAVKPRRGMSQLASLVDRLNNIKVKGVSNFEEAMMRYKKQLKGRCLVLVISDFLFDEEEIKNGLMRLGKHEVKVVQVLDREEKEMKMYGDVKLFDSETNQILKTFMSRRLRQKYVQKLNDHSSKIHDVCVKLGAGFCQITSDDDLFDSFYKVLRHSE